VFRPSHGAGLLVLLLLLSFTIATSASSPPYAKPGGFAQYSAFGGFIPFSGGVNGSVVFSVRDVYANGTMLVSVRANVSNGEFPNGTFNMLDYINNPRLFPAFPPSNFTSKILFDASVFSEVRATSISVPAGTFDVKEYSGIYDGTETYYWFDVNSGIAVEMSRAGGVMQLNSSNIAMPTAVPSGFENSLPYFALFVAAGVASVLSYYFVKRAYVKPQQPGLEKISSEAKKSETSRKKETKSIDQIRCAGS
jgi:hypothetical protein